MPIDTQTQNLQFSNNRWSMRMHKFGSILSTSLLLDLKQNISSISLALTFCRNTSTAMNLSLQIRHFHSMIVIVH